MPQLDTYRSIKGFFYQCNGNPMIHWWTAFILLYFGSSHLIYGQSSNLRSGPLVGYSTAREVAVWLQTKSSSQVQLRYWPQQTPKTVTKTSLLTTTAAESFIGRITLTNLIPGTTYNYAVYLDGRRVNLPYPTTFQTQALWAYRTEPPNFKCALGSCNYVVDSVYDRPGKPYGGDYHIFVTLSRAQPDLMLWLGDNTYLREADWTSRSGIDYRYAHTRALPELQPLWANTHHYALWDDHDYGPNDSDRGYVFKQDALQTFQRYWPNPPAMTGDSLNTITTSFYWSDVEFFMLDNRFYRTPNNRITGERTLFGKKQLNWLIDALKSSKATFKIVCSGGQILNTAAKYENMVYLFPEERNQLLSLLEKEQINGVVILSGDRHHSELSKLERPNSYPLYELTVSPLTAGPAPQSIDEANTLRVPETFVGQRNFGIIEFTGPRKERQMHIRIYDSIGNLLWQKAISSTELQFKK